MRKAAQRQITRAVFALCATGLTVTAGAMWMAGYPLLHCFATLFTAIACMAMVLRD